MKRRETMTLKRFLLYTRFTTKRPAEISTARWNAMLKYAETKIFVRRKIHGSEEYPYTV